MKSRPVFFRISRNRKKAASAPSMRPKALSGSIAKYSRGLALSVLTLIGAPAVSQAAAYYWNTGTNTWSGTFWSDNATTGGVTGVLPTSSDTITFNQSSVNGAETVSLAAAQSVLGITFSNTGTTLLQGGGTNRILTIGTSGITINSGAGAVTIGNAAANQNVAVTVNGPQSWANNSATTFTVVNAVTGGANTLTLDGTGNGLTTLTGGLSFSGAGGLVIGKSGTLGTTISGGTITLGGTGGIVINSGASAVGLGANTVSASQSWTNNSATTFTVSGATAAGATTLTLIGAGDGLTTLTGGLTFSGAGGLVIGKAGALGTTISGGTITLGGTGGIVINSGASAVGLGANTVSASQSWTNNSATTFTVSGATAAGATTLTLNGAGDGLTTLTGNLTFSGAGRLVIGKAGALGTTISGGTITLGGTGGIVINSGASAVSLGANTVSASQSWTNNSATTFTASGLTGVNTGVTLTLGGTGDGLTTLTGGLTTNGTAGLVIGKSGALGTTISGGTITLTGSGGITINSGASAVSLGAATLGVAQTWTNNSSSLFTVSGDITNSTFGLTIAGSGNTTASGVLGLGSGSGGLTKSGTGTLTLTNANLYTGTTAINAGTVTLNRNTGSLNGNALTFGGPGTFNMDNTGAGVALAQSLGALTFSAGDGTVQITRTEGQDQTITFSSLATRGVGATGNFVNTGGTNSATNGIILTGVTADAPMGPGYFFNGGTANANYAYYNAATSFVRGINWGVDATTSTAAGGAIATIAYAQSTGSTTATIATGQVFTGLNFQNTTATAQAVNLAGTITTDGILRSGNGASTTTISGGTSIKTTTANADLVIRTDMASDALTITTPILLNGTSGLTKSGAGTLVLGGTNTYNGATYVNGGTLSISSNANLGNENTGSGNVTVISSSVNNSDVTISGAAPAGFTIGSSLLGSVVTSITGAGVTLAGRASSSIVSATSTPFTFVGNSLFLNGATLRTTGNVGLFNGTWSTNNRPIAISNGATFNTDAGTTLTVGGGISGTGGLTKSGTGQMTIISGVTNSFTGGVTVTGGTLFLRFQAQGTTNMISASNAVTLNSAVLTAQPYGGNYDSQTFNGVTLASGNNSITTVQAVSQSFWGTELTLGTIIRNPGTTLGADISFGLTTTKNSNIAVSNTNTNGILGPWATVLTGANTSYAKVVNTSLTNNRNTIISQNSSTGTGYSNAGLGYTGGADGTAATDANGFVSGTVNYGFTTTVPTTLTGPSTAYTARYSGVGGTINLGAGSNTLTLGGLLNAGTGTLTIDGTGGSGTVVVEATTNELIVNTANAAIAISAPITNNGLTAGTLTKTGSNRLTLSGANTYSGGTYLNAGVLALGSTTSSTTALGTGTLRINGGSLDSTVANLVNANNNAQTWNGNFGFVGTNSLNLGIGAVTLTDNRTVAVTASTLTVGGIIGDGGSGFGLTKSGLGTLALTGVNTFSGATNVIQGAIGGTGTIAGAVTLSSTGGIDLRDGAVGTLTLGSTLAITGASGANNLYFDLASAGSTTDKIAVTGAFSMTTSGAGVVNVNQLGGVGNRLTAGTYDIITAASGLSAANFQLATTKAFGQTFGLTSPDAQTLRLTTAQVTSATPTAFWAGTTDVNWSSSTNWRTTVAGGGAVAGAPDYLTNVTFATTNPVATRLSTNVLDVDFDINSLTFNSGLTAITIGGTTKTLTLEAAAGAGITSTQTTVTNTISAKVGLAASQTWSVAGTTAALGGLTVSGVISDFGAGYSLTKAGAGTLTLSGANTFTGVVSITGGILSVNSLANGGVASSLGMSVGAASNLLLGNGTTLQYTGGTASTDRSFTINGTAAGHGATLDASGSAAINFTNTASPAYGTANQTRTLTLTGTSTQTNTLAANIADNGTGAVSVAKTGAGTWVLSGNSSFTGGLTLSGGAVRVSTDANLGDASGPITVTSDSTLQIGVSAIATVASSRQINLNGGTLSFTFGFAGSTNSFSTYGKVTGSGNIQATVPSGQSFTLSLNSTSNDFTGAVTIDAVSNGGVNTLLVNAASLADATGSGNIRFGRTNSLTVMTQQFTYTGTSALTLNNRKIEFITGGAANSNSVLSSTLAAINVNTDLVVASGGNSKLTLDAPTGITSTFNGKLINGSLATLITKTGAGTWVLTGANTYTGATSITGGTLIARNGTAFGTTGTANVTVATQTGMSYYAATDVPLNIAGTLGITGGTATVIGGSIGSTTTSAQINVAGNATATAAAIKVNIYGNSFSTTTSGTNTYTLVKGNGGANTLSTATSLTLGTVYNNTNFTVGALSKTTSTIDVAITQQTALSGNVLWKGGLTGATGVWSASNGTTQSNWQVTDTVNQPLAPSSTSDLVFSTATSPGTMVGMALGSDVSVRTMTINNTATAFGLLADGYTLTITPGTSAAGITIGSNVLASSINTPVALGASQTWTNNSVNSLTVSGRVSGGGNNLTTAGTGTIILAGPNTYTGATTVSAGTLQIGNGGTTGSLSPSSAITNNAALVFNRTDTLTQGTHFASTISGTGTVTQAGTGTLVLSGPNSYDGVTNVNSGTLNIRNNDALGTATNTITVASGAKLQLQSGITVPSAKSLTISQPALVFASGGTETSYGVYTVRTFTSNGSLTVTSGSGGTVDYLVIGGGGGGGGNPNSGATGGGGGGAGGFLSGSETITSSAAVTVGSFGAKGDFSSGFNGGNSILAVTGGNTVTAIGGGGGGYGVGGVGGVGSSGASGGGGSGNSGSGGAATQGNVGGNGSTSLRLAGGGGGAGAPGGNAPGSSGGSGGAGASSSITGITTFYAGGGGGGQTDVSGTPSVGGIGGGGYNPGNNIAGTDATYYGSGGGGQGGGGVVNKGGNGFQGVVIVRYVGSAALENVSGNNTFSGAITLGSNVAIGSLQDTLTLGGAIGDSGSGYGITKLGNGTLALPVANTYAGATSVLQGTLEVTANDALGTIAAGTSVASGATLKLTGVNYSTAEGLIINGTGVSSGGALASSGTTTFAGLITAATNATINAISGTLELSGGLVKNGTTLTFTGAGAFTISSVISGASANSDLVVDATTVTLTEQNTYNGPTTITNGGTLIANVLGALPLSPRTAVSFTGTGTSALNLGADQFVASLSSAGAATVALGSNTLTVGIAGGNTTFAGSIGGTGGNLVKDTNSTQVLSGANGYTGTTTVNGGTLEVQGSLSGTTAVTVNTGGTLLMNSAASDIMNTTATVAMAGGTLAFGNAANQIQNLGAMTLTANSILDFGAGGGNDKFHFAGFVNTAGTLAITNWLGNDAGGTDGAHDRLVFTGLFTDFTSSFSQSQISFNGTSGYAAIDFGGTSYEIVPVPEPATTALIGSIALCALIGYRERRRFTGLGKRTAARK